MQYKYTLNPTVAWLAYILRIQTRRNLNSTNFDFQLSYNIILEPTNPK